MSTVKQITKQLKQAEIDLTNIKINRDEVEIYVETKAGEYSRKLTDTLMHKVAKVLGWGGYRCGYGAWVLQANYEDWGDPMSKSSKWNY